MLTYADVGSTNATSQLKIPSILKLLAAKHSDENLTQLRLLVVSAGLVTYRKENAN
jgi:hypothetical protein